MFIKALDVKIVSIADICEFLSSLISTFMKILTVVLVTKNLEIYTFFKPVAC